MTVDEAEAELKAAEEALTLAYVDGGDIDGAGYEYNAAVTNLARARRLALEAGNA